MASLHDDGNRSRVQANGAREHGESLRRNKLNGGIDLLLRQLLNTPAGRAPARQAQLDLFAGRASLASITAWRFGWMTLPPWAFDLLCERITARQVELDRLKATLPRRGPGRGERGTRHLAAWRERKAREKEKAAEMAALQHETKNSI